MKKGKIVSLFLLVSILSISQAGQAYDPEYLNEVVGRKAASFGDGCELIMYLLRLEGEYPTFESQMDFLERNRLVRHSLGKKPANTPLRRDELAYMLGKTLRLKGGLKAQLLGWNRRFAMEELIHQGIMREGHGADFMTGQELVVIMTRAAEHMAGRMK